MGIGRELRRGISRQLSTGSVRRSLRRQLSRQASLDPRRNNLRFTYGRQSSLDPIHRSPTHDDLGVPHNLDSTMQLLFLACTGDVKGVEDLLDEGVDVNSIDLDGRTALHIASCEGHLPVVNLLLVRMANLDARDRWGSTAACDAKFYGNIEIFNVLKSRGAKAAKTRKTPMAVANPREVPEYELNPHELQVRKCDGISKGTYQVAKWNGTKVSVKILDKDSYSDLDSINAFKHELMLLEKVRHPNVVQFVGAVTQNIPMMIVSEYHPNGDLASYLLKKGRLSMKKVIKFSIDIARGMNYLHECKPDPVIHCDLKPKNILMDSGGQLKIAGFGLLTLSKISPNKAKLTNQEALTLLKSGPYVAPEIYKECEFEKSVDVFSFGVMLYELIEGVQPFHPKSPEEAGKLLCLEGKRPPFRAKVKNYPPDTKELIEECWNPEPNLRPSFSIIIARLDKLVLSFSKHGWLKDTFRLPWK